MLFNLVRITFFNVLELPTNRPICTKVFEYFAICGNLSYDDLVSIEVKRIGALRSLSLHHVLKIEMY